MKSNKRSGGIGSSITSIIWLIIVAAIVIAFCKVNNIRSINDLWTYCTLKSNEVQACLSKSLDAKAIKCALRLKVGQNVNKEQDKEPSKEQTKTENKKDDLKIPKDSGLKQLPATKMNSKEAINKLNSLDVVNQYNIDAYYSRADWKHWLPVNRKHHCWNTREETLYNQSFKDMVFYDKNKNETKDKSKACSIKSATWIDPLSNEKINKPGQLDVDHIVPLALVAKSGGMNWDRKTKATYANDPDVLIVTSNKQNRSKGAKSPSEWMPPNKESHCDYAKIYINVLSKYKLKITAADKEVLKKALASCPV